MHMPWRLRRRPQSVHRVHATARLGFRQRRCVRTRRGLDILERLLLLLLIGPWGTPVEERLEVNLASARPLLIYVHGYPHLDSSRIKESYAASWHAVNRWIVRRCCIFFCHTAYAPRETRRELLCVQLYTMVCTRVFINSPSRAARAPERLKL